MKKMMSYYSKNVLLDTIYFLRNKYKKKLPTRGQYENTENNIQ